MDLEYKDAARLCLDLFSMRKAIQAAIDKNRHKLLRRQVAMLKKAVPDFNPQGDEFAQSVHEELPAVEVRWGRSNDTFVLEHPESWMASFKEALGLFKNVYGQKVYTIMVLRYGHRWGIDTVCKRQGITRQAYYYYHKNLASMLLLIAVQNGLIRVEKNHVQKGDELYEPKIKE